MSRPKTKAQRSPGLRNQQTESYSGPEDNAEAVVTGFRFECVCGREDAKADPGHGSLGPRWFVNCYSASCGDHDYPARLAEAVGAPSAFDFLANADKWLEARMIGRVRRRNGIAWLPTVREIHGWQRNLRDNPRLIDYLERERGLTAKVIGRYRLGFVRGGQSPWREFDKFGAFTLPVFTPTGRVITVRRRFYPRTPIDESGRRTKYASLFGHAAALYPDLPSAGPMILCAGEFDALVGRSNDLRTVSTTCGASLPAELAERFRLRDVAVIFDAQESEQRAASRVVERLNEAGAHAWRVDLRDAGLTDGEDLTDWFVTHGRSATDLRRFAELRWIKRVNRNAAA